MVQENQVQNQGGRPSPSPSSPSPSQANAGVKKEVKRLMRKFPTPETALLAASWGEQATERWMKNGGDPSEIPEEDKRFVSEMLPKIKQGMNERVESERVVQDPSGGPSREDAKAGRRRAREEMLAAGVAQGAQSRSSAREAARGQLQKMRSRRGQQEAQSPQVSRRAPDQA